jgi:hypothetical protein
MRNRRLADVTIILLIGIVLMALVIYFSPKNPYCFRHYVSLADRMRTVAECLKGGPLEGSSPAPGQTSLPFPPNMPGALPANAPPQMQQTQVAPAGPPVPP